jgi:hypothetical protein
MVFIHDTSVPSNAPGRDVATRVDRAFFARHPLLRQYVRELIPGEFSSSEFPVPLDCELEGLVKITRLSSHVRVREVLTALVSRKRA